MKVEILRLSHRPERDKRVTTHVFLVARAFGAKKIYYTGERDPSVEESLRKVNEKWGGSIEVEFTNSYKKLIFQKRKEGFLIVHLTMYGVSLLDKLNEIKKRDKILVIVGSEKVPGEIYELADLNISIGNQPHSEVAALAVFLDRVLDGKVFKISFENSKYKIVPSEKGKKVIRISE